MTRLILILATLIALAPAARASICQAYVDGLPDVQVVSLTLPVQATALEVTITYVAHSTFRIETPGGVVIATDFFGMYGTGRLPDVVTMNKAHATHYTSTPNPAIRHVLRGWDPAGGVAAHQMTLADTTIRNVTTDLRSGLGREADANSIFVFEVADLCIGHLGHLHHPLTEGHYAALGRLDVVMAPVDGGVTLPTAEVVALMQRLKARLVLPMHAFGPTSLARFLDGMAGDFDIRNARDSSVTVGLDTLPSRPTVLVLTPSRTDPTYYD